MSYMILPSNIRQIFTQKKAFDTCRNKTKFMLVLYEEAEQSIDENMVC